MAYGMNFLQPKKAALRPNEVERLKCGCELQAWTCTFCLRPICQHTEHEYSRDEMRFCKRVVCSRLGLERLAESYFELKAKEDKRVAESATDWMTTEQRELFRRTCDALAAKLWQRERYGRR